MNQPTTQADEVRILREALRDYGVHHVSCMYHGCMDCTCGFDAARAALAIEPAAETAPCVNCGHALQRQYCFCPNCAEPTPWMPTPPAPSPDILSAADALADRDLKIKGMQEEMRLLRRFNHDFARQNIQHCRTIRLMQLALERCKRKLAAYRSARSGPN